MVAEGREFEGYEGNSLQDHRHYLLGWKKYPSKLLGVNE
jgi:hypothetical protein